MSKTIFIPLIGALLFLSPACDLLDDNGSSDKEVTGTWDPGAGLNYPFSFRNARYTFEVKADKSPVTLTLESQDADVALWLYNPLGQQVDRNWGDRIISMTQPELAAGKYTVVAGTDTRGEKGTFNLSVTGNVSALTPISGNSKIATGEWKTNGGGLNYPGSFRNHHYTVEITEENSTLDVILESTGANGALWVYNPLGQQLDRNWGDRNIFSVSGDPTKGTYYIVAGTEGRNVLNASYKLNVNGQIGALTQIQSQDICVDGNIATGAGLNNPVAPGNATYSFDVTDDNTFIDVVLESPDFNLVMWVYNPLGQLVDRNWGDRALFEVAPSNKGKWKVVVGTEAVGASGKFKLCVVGKFNNFKKE